MRKYYYIALRQDGSIVRNELWESYSILRATQNNLPEYSCYKADKIIKVSLEEVED